MNRQCVKRYPGRGRGFSTLALAISACGTLAPVEAQIAPTSTTPLHEADTYAGLQAEEAYAAHNLAASPRHGQWVSIRLRDRTLRAFVTFPAPAAAQHGKVPVVIVPHEVFGLTDSTRNTADRIAALSCITIAPDMASGLAPNGGGTPDFASAKLASGAITSELNDVVNAQFDAWADYGLHLPRANGQLAIAGLSWGGGAGFRYAGSPTHNKALRFVAVFYDIGPPAFQQGPDRSKNGSFAADGIDVPVYGFYGSRDTRVMNSLDATRAAMAAAHKTYEATVFDGADHAFMRVGEDPANTNPANRTAVKASMDRLRVLIDGLRQER